MLPQMIIIKKLFGVVIIITIMFMLVGFTSFPPFLNLSNSSSLNVVMDIDFTRCGGLIPRLVKDNKN